LDPDFQPWSKDVLGFQVNRALPWCKYFALAGTGYPKIDGYDQWFGSESGLQ
jgi:hypothetical protein